MARAIASKSPLTVAIGKRAFYDQIEQPVAAAYDLAARVMVENLLAADAREGIGAFIDKRTAGVDGTLSRRRAPGRTEARSVLLICL